MFQNLKDFWALVVDVWKNGAYGVDIGKILAAILIILVFLVIRRLFSKFILNRLSKLTEKSETDFDDELFVALEKPLRFVPVVMGIFFAVEYLDPTGLFALVLKKIMRSLVAFNIFWALFNLVDPFSFVFRRLKQVFSVAFVDWLIKIIKGALVFVGAATVLDVWGIKVGPIIAGLGLFGVAVALGAQDLFKNLISGLLIIAERRFTVGDWILVDGIVEGTVENIGFRSTVVRRFDKAPVFVPNAKLSDNSVTNFSAMTHRRIYWTIGVEYRTTIDQLRAIRDRIEAYLTESGDFAQPPYVPLFVRVDNFGPSSIDIMVYCFTKTTVWGEWLEIKEALAYRIKEIVLGEGSSFAFPSQSVYVETLPGEKPETYFEPQEMTFSPKKGSAEEAGDVPETDEEGSAAESDGI